MNQRSGYGKWTYNDNSTYEGYWKDKMRNGTGTYINENGVER